MHYMLSFYSVLFLTLTVNEDLHYSHSLMMSAFSPLSCCCCICYCCCCNRCHHGHCICISAAPSLSASDRFFVQILVSEEPRQKMAADRNDVAIIHLRREVRVAGAWHWRFDIAASQVSPSHSATFRNRSSLCSLVQLIHGGLDLE